MNAAYLLVATSWLAGAGEDKPAAAPAPVVAAPISATSCGGCGATSACCEKEGLLDKLRGKFQRNDCDSCGRESFLDRLKGKMHKDKGCGCETTCAAPAPAPACSGGCGSCADACKPKFGDKLKGLFSKKSDCGTCDTGCATGGCATTTVAPAAPAKVEPVPAPKPGTPAQPLPKGGEVRAIPQISAPVLEIAPAKSSSPF